MYIFLVGLHDLVGEVLEIALVAGPHHLRPALDQVVLERALLTVARLLTVGADHGRVLTRHHLSPVRQLHRDGPAAQLLTCVSNTIYREMASLMQHPILQ